MVRNYLYAVLAAIAIMLAVGGGVMAADTEKTDRLIYTSATGEVVTTPDEAMLSVSVDTEHQNAKVAQEQNAQAMSRIIEAMVNAGIQKSDLQTSGYSIYPIYDEQTPLRMKVKLYRVSNTLQIRLRSVERAGEILDMAVASGANRINYISFQISDARLQQLRTTALKDAVAKSRLDAEAVAEAAGLRITGIREISTTGASPPVLYATARYAEAAYSTPIEAGEMKVSAQVSVTYLCA
ncbi:MAG: SIMPL domain-containing protein [Methanomicrobiales archaeon]|nr:SIMPL domain-containing protein [Methanomicrobiales archaeon]